MSARPFENIANFRDVAESVNSFSHRTVLKSGLLFRSARPDEATNADRNLLVDRYGMKTIIDLRTTTEHINAAKKHSEAAALAQPAVLPGSGKLVSELIKIPDIDYAEINLNGKGFERALVWKLSYLNLAKVIGYMAFGYRMDAISIIAREVLQPRGLIGLGIDTLEHSKAELKEVFDVFSNKNAWPILVHCTQGKDRTGIIIVLVLLLCGININAITSDYVLSEAELKLENQMQEVSSIGLDESFSKCPPDFPSQIQQYIEERYGTLQAFLTEIGVVEGQLQGIRSILQVDDEQN